MHIEQKIDDTTQLPKGAKIIQIMETKSGILLGLCEDSTPFVWYNGAWCKFTSNFVEDEKVEEAAPDAPAEV